MSHTILIADDHQVLRSGLRVLFEKQDDMKVVAEASNGREAIELANQWVPDVALIDISMPDLNGVEASKRMLHDNPDIKIIALSMHKGAEFVEKMFLAGACGYLVKHGDFDEVIKAVRDVLDGDYYLSEQIENVSISNIFEQNRGQKKSGRSILTPREREILQLIAESKNTKQISQICNISVKTVETHRMHIMKKLGIDNLPGLTKYAIREGITTLED